MRDEDQVRNLDEGRNRLAPWAHFAVLVIEGPKSFQRARKSVTMR